MREIGQAAALLTLLNTMQVKPWPEARTDAPYPDTRTRVQFAGKAWPWGMTLQADLGEWQVAWEAACEKWALRNERTGQIAFTAEEFMKQQQSALGLSSALLERLADLHLPLRQENRLRLALREVQQEAKAL